MIFVFLSFSFSFAILCNYSPPNQKQYRFSDFQLVVWTTTSHKQTRSFTIKEKKTVETKHTNEKSKSIRSILYADTPRSHTNSRYFHLFFFHRHKHIYLHRLALFLVRSIVNKKKIIPENKLHFKTVIYTDRYPK